MQFSHDSMQQFFAVFRVTWPFWMHRERRRCRDDFSAFQKSFDGLK